MNENKRLKDKVISATNVKGTAIIVQIIFLAVLIGFFAKSIISFETKYILIYIILPFIGAFGPLSSATYYAEIDDVVLFANSELIGIREITNRKPALYRDEITTVKKLSKDKFTGISFILAIIAAIINYCYIIFVYWQVGSPWMILYAIPMIFMNSVISIALITTCGEYVKNLNKFKKEWF